MSAGWVVTGSNTLHLIAMVGNSLNSVRLMVITMCGVDGQRSSRIMAEVLRICLMLLTTRRTPLVGTERVLLPISIKTTQHLF